MGFPELFNDLRGHLVVFQEVVGDGIADPGGPLGRAELQQLVPRLLEKRNRTNLASPFGHVGDEREETGPQRGGGTPAGPPFNSGCLKTCTGGGGTHPVALQVSHLDLKQGQVSQDLQVVFVPLQGVPVTLDGLVVLLIGALQEAVDVPAWDTCTLGKGNNPSKNRQQPASWAKREHPQKGSELSAPSHSDV